MTIRRPLCGARWSAAAFTLAAFACPPLAAASQPAQMPCYRTAHEAWKSCREAAQAELWLARAKCSNLLDASERNACRVEALDDYLEQIAECGDQREARIDLCDELGPNAYAPDIDPDDFVPLVTNPWMPLVPGTTRVYHKQTSSGLERTEVTVTHDTKVIQGVTCTAVSDKVFEGSDLVEDTIDWFAQDECGNVWYFGEISREYEDGELVGLDGSWKAGENGAHAGIVMLANPTVGRVYRQEFLLGEAEDVAEFLSSAAFVSVPYGNFPNCRKTFDNSPLEPGSAGEHKFYAHGVGLVRETSLGSGSHNVLVAIQGP